jgi:DNA-binding transcriptional LysR family regulator
MRFARAVAQAKSFSAAAIACRVSQPSLSNSVANLEQELGGPLFHRTTRHVELTALGEKLLPLIEGVIESSDHLAAAAAAEHNPQLRLIRIGLSPLVSSQILAQALTPFERRHAANTKVVLKQCFLDDLRERLRRQTLDVAVVPSGFFGNGYRRCTFYSDTLEYLAAEREPGSGGEGVPDRGISLQEAGRDTFVLTADGCGLTPMVRQLFRKARIPMQEYPGCALNHQVIEEWVGLGLASGLLPKRKLTSQRPRSRTLLRNGQPVAVTYELVWPTRSAAGAHVTALIRHFREVVPKLIAGSAISAPRD